MSVKISYNIPSACISEPDTWHQNLIRKKLQRTTQRIKDPWIISRQCTYITSSRHYGHGTVKQGLDALGLMCRPLLCHDISDIPLTTLCLLLTYRRPPYLDFFLE